MILSLFLQSFDVSPQIILIRKERDLDPLIRLTITLLVRFDKPQLVESPSQADSSR
jgi:hypothetical protein